MDAGGVAFPSPASSSVPQRHLPSHPQDVPPQAGHRAGVVCWRGGPDGDQRFSVYESWWKGEREGLAVVFDFGGTPPLFNEPDNF